MKNVDIKDCETYSDIREYCEKNGIQIDVTSNKTYATNHNPRIEFGLQLEKDSGIIIKVCKNSTVTRDDCVYDCLYITEQLDNDSELSVEKLKEMITNLNHYQIFKKHRKN